MFACNKSLYEVLATINFCETWRVSATKMQIVVLFPLLFVHAVQQLNIQCPWGFGKIVSKFPCCPPHSLRLVGRGSFFDLNLEKNAFEFFAKCIRLSGSPLVVNNRFKIIFFWKFDPILLIKIKSSRFVATLRGFSRLRSRGVTRLDGARGKKQVWRPSVRTWGLSEANVLLKKVLMTLLGLFGELRPLAPLVAPLLGPAVMTLRRCRICTHLFSSNFTETVVT